MVFGEADPFGGWGSLILQGGAFGLLTYVVCVLAPKSLKDAREERAATQTEREARDDKFSQIIAAMNEKFGERNSAIVRGIEAQTTVLAQKIDAQTMALSRSLDTACKGTRWQQGAGER